MWALRTFAPSTTARLVAAVPKGFAMTSEDARFVIEFIDSLFPVRLEGFIFDAFVSNADVNNYNLEAISVPTLIIHTRDDQLASHEVSKRAAERIPGARFVSLESGGHLMLGKRRSSATNLPISLPRGGIAARSRWHLEHRPLRITRRAANGLRGKSKLISCQNCVRPPRNLRALTVVQTQRNDDLRFIQPALLEGARRRRAVRPSARSRAGRLKAVRRKTRWPASGHAACALSTSGDSGQARAKAHDPMLARSKPHVRGSSRR